MFAAIASLVVVCSTAYAAAPEPGTPPAVSALAGSDRSVTATITPGTLSSDTIVGYQLRTLPGKQMSFVSSGTPRFLTVARGLAPGTTYHAVVRAVGANGVGAWSQLSKAKTATTDAIMRTDTNTGVMAGAQLTDVGNLVVNQDNFDGQNLRIHAFLANGKNGHLKNCVIESDGSSHFGTVAWLRGNGWWLQNVTIIGDAPAPGVAKGPSVGIATARDTTLDKVLITGTGDGIRPGDGAVVTDSSFHDSWRGFDSRGKYGGGAMVDTPHTDFVQWVATGHATVRGNYVDMRTYRPDGSLDATGNSVIRAVADNGPIDDILYEYNITHGGNVAVEVGGRYTASNVIVRYNELGDQRYNLFGFSTNSPHSPNSDHYGNVDVNSGAPVDKATAAG